MKLPTTGYGGTLTIGGITIPIKSWTIEPIKKSWWKAWIKRTPRGFTLVELLVVITIIGLVSAATIPTVVSVLGERHLIGSVQALQGAITQARDLAVSSNSPAGIRLMPSLTDPTKLDRVVPLFTPERYSEGMITMLPAPTVPGPLTITGNGFSNWAYNVRLGDKVVIASHSYTVCGPMVNPNADLFVNIAPGQPVEWLFLVNGIDDNHDGYVDNGWDGYNNDDQNGIDDPGEWETETWQSPVISNALSPYVITRGPAPDAKHAIFELKTPIDLATSTLFPNLISGNVDLVVQPTGQVTPSLPYSVPTSIGMQQAKSVFNLMDTDGNSKALTLWSRSGLMETN